MKLKVKRVGEVEEVGVELLWFNNIQSPKTNEPKQSQLDNL